MTPSFIVLVVLFIGVAAAIAYFPIDKPAHQALCVATNLPDHDLTERKVTQTSTAWSHAYFCNHCHEVTGHNEFMTKICLSCGQFNANLMASGAHRKVTRNGAWIDNYLIKGKDYLRIDGVMVRAKKLSTSQTNETDKPSVFEPDQI